MDELKEEIIALRARHEALQNEFLFTEERGRRDAGRVRELEKELAAEKVKVCFT